MHIDCEFWDGPMVIELSNGAMGMLIRLCAYADRYDPTALVPPRVLTTVEAIVDGHPSDELEELIEAGFVRRVGALLALDVSALEQSGLLFNSPLVMQESG